MYICIQLHNQLYLVSIYILYIYICTCYIYIYTYIYIYIYIFYSLLDLTKNSFQKIAARTVRYYLQTQPKAGWLSHASQAKQGH